MALLLIAHPTKDSLARCLCEACSQCAAGGEQEEGFDDKQKEGFDDKV